MEKNVFWSRVINVIISVLSAVATTFGLNQF
ncbi:MAG: smalltalk protein [Bacteroidaceae bacterium]|nr:smalltalk protein [Bacteroidaceae bacterium]